MRRRSSPVGTFGWTSVVMAAVLITLGCGGERPASDSAASAGSPAPRASSADADLRDVSRYELTMDKIDKYIAASRNMAIAAKNLSPAERERLKMKGDAESNANATLDDMAAHIDREPLAREAVQRAGLSAREFAVISMAYLQAAMAQAVLQMRPDIKNTDSIAAEMKANPANIRFVTENKAAIESKFKALEADMKAAGMER